MAVILLRIWRRSVSSFVSPGPLVPIPPPKRDKYFPWPTRRGNKYSSWANSTCSFPYFDRARKAKMSKISWTRSITGTTIKSAIV